MLLSASFLACAGDAGPRLPAVVRVSDGDGQIARVGTLLPAPIVVTVLNSDGQPAAGMRVAWRTADGRVLPIDAKTDALGKARARWELGLSEGARTAEATLPGAEPAVFTAIAESRDRPQPRDTHQQIAHVGRRADEAGQERPRAVRPDLHHQRHAERPLAAHAERGDEAQHRICH